MKLKSILMVLFLVLSCGKNPEQTSESQEDSFASRNASPSVSAVADESPLSISRETSTLLTQQTQENQLGKIFLPINTSKDRLLEYNVQLSYHCDDLIKTRKELLHLISKYGYLEASSAVNSNSPYMTVKIRVASNTLYDALQELDHIGLLLSEDISTTDHTEGIVWQKRKATREIIRQRRRNLASGQITAGAKNWQQVEDSVSSSEDQLDLSEHETWKINDRVKWATVNLSYTTPVPADAIQIPAYKNAFVGLLNLFLELTYYLIWMLPFLIVFATIYYYGNKIFIRYRKK